MNDHLSMCIGLAEYDYPMFKSKAEVVSYLTDYASLYGIENNIRFSTTVSNMTLDDSNNTHPWLIETTSGAGIKQKIRTKYAIVCTGASARPFSPHFLGEEKFKGKILHSWGIENCDSFRNQRVLIVGSGNSADELLVDCANQPGTTVDLLTGAPRLFIPKTTVAIMYKIHGTISKCLGLAPITPVAEELHAMKLGGDDWCKQQLTEDRIVRRMSPDLGPYGIDMPPPLVRGESFQERRSVIDVGAVDLIRGGKVHVMKGQIAAFTEDGVDIQLTTADTASASAASSTASDSHDAVTHKKYDSVILATVR